MSSALTWTLAHGRQRVAAIQVWTQTGPTTVQLVPNPSVIQDVGAGVVTVTFGSPEAGTLIVI
jgi:hypothetical protein